MGFLSNLKQGFGVFKDLFLNANTSKFASCGKGVILERPAKIVRPQNVFLGNDIAIRGFFTFISHTGRLFIKDHVDISQHLTVVTGNHTLSPNLDKWQVQCNHEGHGDIELDTIIENDVWIGINVTLMPGVTIGRGSIIGAGSIVTKSIPPYTIAVGNPCKVIKMKFNYEEIVERENLLYDEKDRLPLNLIEDIICKYSDVK